MGIHIIADKHPLRHPSFDEKRGLMAMWGRVRGSVLCTIHATTRSRRSSSSNGRGIKRAAAYKMPAVMRRRSVAESG